MLLTWVPGCSITTKPEAEEGSSFHVSKYEVEMPLGRHGKVREAAGGLILELKGKVGPRGINIDIVSIGGYLNQ